MLEGIQILIDRMEMFPDEFRGGGNLNDYLYILDDPSGGSAQAAYYREILTEEEIAAYKEATLKYHREAFNRRVIETVMQGEQARESRLVREMKQSMQNTTQTLTNALNSVFTNSDGVIGGGAFTTKTGALFTPANTTKKKK